MIPALKNLDHRFEMSAKEMKKEFGKYLKKKREYENLSRQDLAVILGYTGVQFIYNWESGMVLPPLGKIRVIADALKVSAEKIFEDIEKITIQEVEEDLRRRFYA